MKDHFSPVSAGYSQFRPDYPDNLVDFILSHVKDRDTAIDVATGNGQLAIKLAAHFHKVDAVDISHNQLERAKRELNVIYHTMPAEQLDFPDTTFDLLTVAQAVHWFDFDLFYAEAGRVLKPGGIIALVGYNLFSSFPRADSLLRNFYGNIVGTYWHPERRWIDANYQTLPFPFDEIETPDFPYRMQWDVARVLGYLETWSAVSQYKAHHNENPVDLIRGELTEIWGGGERDVVFPVFLRIGRKP